MYFKSNIRFLRERKGFSQEGASTKLSLKRTSLNNYENGYAEPKLEVLLLFSDFYKMSIDSLIKVDLANLSENQLKELESGNDVYIKGSKLRVLATTIDSQNKENVELVPLKAKAGYTNGYNDPEFISGLPTFQLPFLSQNKKYRTFQIDGDSMLPVPDKAYITAEYVTDWNEVKDGHAYIILTFDAGLVFKVVYSHIKSKKKVLLRSLNHSYQPYEIEIADIKEIWKFVYFTSHELPEPLVEKDTLLTSVVNLQQDVYKLMEKVDQVLDR